MEELLEHQRSMFEAELQRVKITCERNTVMYKSIEQQVLRVAFDLYV